MTIFSLTLIFRTAENTASLFFDFADGTALILYGGGHVRWYSNPEDKKGLLDSIDEHNQRKSILITRLV